MLANLLAFSSLALTVLPHVEALIRFPCSQLVTERFDPYVFSVETSRKNVNRARHARLVTPGVVSPHLHQIIGGVRYPPALVTIVLLTTMITIACPLRMRASIPIKTSLRERG